MQMHQSVVKCVFETLDAAEACIVKHPGRCLAGAMLLGVMIGWWIKKR